MPLPFPVRSGLAIVVASWLLAGCESIPYVPSIDVVSNVVTPYKVEVVQGNVVTQEQVSQVRVGMSRAQVRDILGSPLLADIFHADRWDYVFTIRRQGTASQRRNIVAMFEGDRLKSLDTGGELPTAVGFVASIDTEKPDGKPPTLALSEDQLRNLKAPPKAAASAAPVPAPAVPAAARTYPPLEPR